MICKVKKVVGGYLGYIMFLDTEQILTSSRIEISPEPIMEWVYENYNLLKQKYVLY